MKRLLSVTLLVGAFVAAPAQALNVFACEPEWGALTQELAGDLVTVDCEQGTLQLHVEADALSARAPATAPPSEAGWGRELFGMFRDNVSDANQGASVLFR